MLGAVGGVEEGEGGGEGVEGGGDGVVGDEEGEGFCMTEPVLFIVT